MLSFDGTLEEFVTKAVDDYKTSTDYSAMLENEQYYMGNNPFLMSMSNRVNIEGTSIDLAPKIKIPSSHFRIIVDHIVGRIWDNPVQYGLNGENATVGTILGSQFNRTVKSNATFSAIHKVSYAFYNMNHVQMFKATEFMPLYDENAGSMIAGIRFWQLDDKKPLNIQLYEIDGFTWWTKNPDSEDLTLLQPKTPYVQTIIRYPIGAGRTEIIADSNYPVLPIVPLYQNALKTSELTLPIRSNINAYDAIKTGFVDEILRNKLLIWEITGHGGNPTQLKEMVDKFEALGIMALRDEEAKVNAKINTIPHTTHTVALAEIEDSIWRDAMITDAEKMTGSSMTQVAIQAATMREMKKMSNVEAEAREFVRQLLFLAGVEPETITFTHTTVSNDLEITNRLMMWVSQGHIPPEELVALEPLFAQNGLAAQIKEALLQQSIGMDEAALAAMVEAQRQALEA